MRKSPRSYTGTEPRRVVVVGDTIISEQGLVAIIGRDPQYEVCGAAHTFEEANNLVRRHRPNVLLIEPFLENRDAIRWIKDLAMEFPRIRILVVSRQSERTYAERAFRAGASGYWMKNSSVDELMRAIETVLAGEIYASRAITSVAMHKFAGTRNFPSGLDVLSNRELGCSHLSRLGTEPVRSQKSLASAAKLLRAIAITSSSNLATPMRKHCIAAPVNCLGHLSAQRTIPDMSIGDRWFKKSELFPDRQ